ncbi:MAG: endonuclease III domain-containing protein [Thermodesulfobacteria bacterium]|nr:endonuclease III domain-containing protein [Thermodesulfobacteriota bacterium]
MAGLFWSLYDHFGPQGWWPGETPFEIAIGAILTQNTNWTNVEKAIHNLKEHGLLNPRAMLELPDEKLAQLIRPAGYYNIKTTRLKHFLRFLHDFYNGNIESMKDRDTHILREELLAIHGIGPETADSILLYSLDKPIFVVDAYTIRILSRHDILDPQTTDYQQVQDIFMDNLPRDPCLYNEFHALFVRLGKEFCKKGKPKCSKCPIEDI